MEDVLNPPPELRGRRVPDRLPAELLDPVLRALVEAIPVGVVVAEAETGRIIFSNRGAERIFGVPISGWAHAPEEGYELFHPDGHPFPPEELPLARALARGEAVAGEEVLVRPAAGAEAVVLASAAPVWDGGGRLLAALTIFQDITERKRAAERERRLREFFSRLLENAPTPIFAISADGRCLLANQATEQALGLPRGEMIGRPLAVFAPPEVVELFESVGGEVLGSGEARWVERAIPTPEGVRHFQAVVFPLRDAAGRVEAVGGIAIDVSRRVAVEAALRVRERAVAASHSALVITDPNQPDDPLVYVNPAFERMTGYPAAELLGRNCRFLQGPETDPAVREAIRRALWENRDITITILNTRKDGTPFWNQLSISPVFDEAGGLVNHVGVMLDVTQEREAEAAIQEREALFRAVFEGAALGIVLVGPDGRPVRVNPAFERLLGYREEELRRVYVGDLVHPDDRPLSEQALEELLRGERDSYVLEKRYLRKDGGSVLGRVAAALVRDAEGRPLFTVGTVEDVTARRRTESRLDAALQRLLQVEAEKKRFYREVIRAVTLDKLRLVDAAEVPLPGEPVLEVALETLPDYAAFRHAVREIALQAGMTEERARDLVAGVGEAATNAIKHAVGGRCVIYVSEDRVSARVEDRGAGIRPEDIPATVLLPGYSTQVSLGMGYTIMLQFADRIWLATGPEGTVVQLEKWLRPEEHPQPPFPFSWPRM